jgi:hypothetical protein
MLTRFSISKWILQGILQATRQGHDEDTEEEEVMSN